MKKVIAIFYLVISTQACLGQSNFSFNEGGSSQTDYFSSIPYENINGKIIFNIKIKDKSYRFILDTGAPTSISQKLFDELKADLITKIKISDINQKTDSLSVVRLNDITLGNINFTNIPTLVVKDNLIFECFQVDGFVGSNLLRNSIVQIDNKNKNIAITNDKKKLTLNPKNSSDLILDGQSSPIITIDIKNKKKGKEDLLLDLGMNAFYELSLNNFKLFNEYEIFKVLSSAKGSNSVGLFGAAEDTLQYRLLLPQMIISNVKILNIPTETSRNDNSGIGSKILEYGVITIDYKNKKFYFMPFEKNYIDASEKKFPIDFMPRNSQLYVSFVWDSKIADKIATGDQIIAIDEISYENINTCDLITKESIFKEKNSLRLITRNSKGEKIETIIERK